VKILGIDYGRKNIGIAVGFRGVIETKPILRGKPKEIFSSLAEICRKEGIERIIIGISEGKMGEQTKRFAKRLTNVLKLPIELMDETLTTYEAKKLKKGKEFDSIAAAILLEKFWLKEGGN